MVVNICYVIQMLYLRLDCQFIPMSALQNYTYVWSAMLYLCLVCKFIPTSVIQYYTLFCYGYFCFLPIWFKACYAYFWFSILYLHLFYPILDSLILHVMASSVISSSAPPCTVGGGCVDFGRIYYFNRVGGREVHLELTLQSICVAPVSILIIESHFVPSLSNFLTCWESEQHKEHK